MQIATNRRKVQPTRTTTAGARRGYTLLEMLIVVTIVAMAAGVALPRINVAAYAADANAQVVRAALQNAQRLAVTRQHDVVVSFDTTRGTVRVLEDMNNNQAADATERVTVSALDKSARFAAPPAPIPASLGGSGVSRAVAGSVKTVAGLPSVVFHRNGAASADVEVYLRATRRTVDEYRGIMLVQSTGRTEWYRYSTLVTTWRKASM